MKTEELYNLLKGHQKKFEVIDKIMDLHPSFGMDLKWSTYTGGMADTGQWYREKLLSVPQYVLEINYKTWSNSINLDVLTPERIKELEQNYFERYGVWLTV